MLFGIELLVSLRSVRNFGLMVFADRTSERASKCLRAERRHRQGSKNTVQNHVAILTSNVHKQYLPERRNIVGYLMELWIKLTS